MGSSPNSGTRFFFFVQINYFMLFMYACISYIDKNESKVLGNLMKITINFWTLCRSKVWICIKVCWTNSIILGTRKLWWIFPINQKFDTMTAFLDNPILQFCKVWECFIQCFQCTMVRKLSTQNWPVLNIFTIKKLLWYQISA